MRIPTYWAEARRQRREGGRQVTVRRFGWSEEGQAAAERMAEERAAAALEEAWADRKVERREPKVPYNGADGVPIREEVLERVGRVVLTRNAYGAVCMNTPDLLIADIDGDDRGRAKTRSCALALLIWPLYLGVMFLCGIRGLAWAAVVFTSPLVPIGIAQLLPRALPGPKQRLERARQAIQRFLDGHPEWRLRLYATPAGLRAIATHRPFDAHAEETRAFFEAVGVDPTYAFLCRHQRCFRARLTAKPWRIGIDSHLKPRPGVWPVAKERLPARREWLAAYDRQAHGFAACRFESELGSGRPDPQLVPQVALHDQRSRATSSLPLG